MPDVSLDGQSCAADCTSNPEGCGITSRGHIGWFTRYWEWNFETYIDERAGDVDGNSKEDGVETLLARNGLEPDGTPHASAIDCIPSGLQVPP